MMSNFDVFLELAGFFLVFLAIAFAVVSFGFWLVYRRDKLHHPLRPEYDDDRWFPRKGQLALPADQQHTKDQNEQT